MVDDLEAILKTDPEIERWSFYIGSGALRFYLPLDQQLANNFFAQAVVVTKNFKVRSGVQQRILTALQRAEFQQVLARVSPLELGPIRAREELLLHELHADERRNEQACGRGNDGILHAQDAIEHRLEST